jgi:hypothetical protein
MALPFRENMEHTTSYIISKVVGKPRKRVSKFLFIKEKK